MIRISSSFCTKSASIWSGCCLRMIFTAVRMVTKFKIPSQKSEIPSSTMTTCLLSEGCSTSKNPMMPVMMAAVKIIHH